MQIIGATPMTRNRRESAPRLLTVTPAAAMALIAAPTKHTPTTSRKCPSVPGPCNPGTQRPRVIRSNSQAEQNDNQTAHHHITKDRARESVCLAGSVIGDECLSTNFVALRIKGLYVGRIVLLLTLQPWS